MAYDNMHLNERLYLAHHVTITPSQKALGLLPTPVLLKIIFSAKVCLKSTGRNFIWNLENKSPDLK